MNKIKHKIPRIGKNERGRKVEENKNENINLEAEENNMQKELEAKLAQKQNEVDEINDRYKRMYAEFENYKKRTLKERETLYNSIMSDIVTSLLPVIDNLEMALNAKTEDTNYKQGIELVYKQFMGTMEKNGVEQIKAEGETFDPSLHEAVSSVIDENLGEKEIKQDLRKGYKIGNRVIRHSMVVVAN